jgi:hypothetical protein
MTPQARRNIRTALLLTALALSFYALFFIAQAVRSA